MALVIRPLIADFVSEYSQIPTEMNAYCTLTIRHQRKFTSMHPCHGNQANWDDEVVFDIDSIEDDLWVELWVQQYGLDRKIGEGNIDLKRHYNRSAYRQSEKMDLKVGDKYIGKLFLTIEYKTTKEELQKLRKKQDKEKPEPVRVPVIETEPEQKNVLKAPAIISTESTMEWATRISSEQSLCVPLNSCPQDKVADDPAGLLTFTPDNNSVVGAPPPFQPVGSQNIGNQPNKKKEWKQNVNEYGLEQNPRTSNNFSPLQMTPQQYQYYMQMQYQQGAGNAKGNNGQQQYQGGQGGSHRNSPNKQAKNPLQHRQSYQQQKQQPYLQQQQQKQLLLQQQQMMAQQRTQQQQLQQQQMGLKQPQKQMQCPPQNYISPQNQMMGSQLYQPKQQQYYPQQQFYNNYMMR